MQDVTPGGVWVKATWVSQCPLLRPRGNLLLFKIKSVIKDPTDSKVVITQGGGKRT